MKAAAFLVVIASSLVSSAFGETFDFKDPKGVNNAQFHLDAPLESINGTANGVSGVVRVDPETFANASGKIEIASASLQVPNPIMNGHLHGEKWLGAKKHPEISFELKGLAHLRKNGVSATADATGTFTLHGVAKEITVPVRVTYLPGRLKDRVPKAEGDLLVIRSEFTIRRSDYG
ncbi:MAG: YceI family protein, partial [Terrimicrobiaceae bacterium]|nr:YceI family protein [Terrimicrobiaceae bacterium]